MNDSLRLAIAAIAGAAINGSKVSSVFDYKTGKWHNTEASVSGGSVKGYCYSSAAHFDGRLSGIFHYGDGSHIEMKIADRKFSGFAYGAGQHFEGTVSGKSVELYVYGEGYTNLEVG